MGGHLDLEKATHGLGTIIVEALAKQLGARVEIVRNPHGTTVSITHGTSDCGWQPLTGVGKHSPPKSKVTKHDRPGRKIPGCSAVVAPAVGTIWGESKLGGRNIKEYLHPRNTDLREVVIRGTKCGEPTHSLLGKGGYGPQAQLKSET